MDSLRIGDADREAAMDLLGEQYSLGRLTKDEFDERSDVLWSARTRGDLAPVFADLPVPATATPDQWTGGRNLPSPSGPPSGRRRFPVSFAPVLLVLVVLTVLTHVPFLPLGLLAWFLLVRRGGVRSLPVKP